MADEAPKQTAKSRRAAADDAGARLEQSTHRTGEHVGSFEEAHEKGFFGEKVDPTPNEDYTAPSPKTNPPPFDPGPKV